MSWLTWVLFGDPTCRCGRIRAACACTTRPDRAVRQQLPRGARGSTAKGKRR